MTGSMRKSRTEVSVTIFSYLVTPLFHSLVPMAIDSGQGLVIVNILVLLVMGEEELLQSRELCLVYSNLSLLVPNAMVVE